jgi:hypothetical protein
MYSDGLCIQTLTASGSCPGATLIQGQARLCNRLETIPAGSFCSTAAYGLTLGFTVVAAATAAVGRQ